MREGGGQQWGPIRPLEARQVGSSAATNLAHCRCNRQAAKLRAAGAKVPVPCCLPPLLPAAQHAAPVLRPIPPPPPAPHLSGV